MSLYLWKKAIGSVWIHARAIIWKGFNEMKYISEKVAYTKGLAQGLGLSDESNEGKVLIQVLDILDDVVDALHGIAEAQEDLESFVEEIDEDLGDLEEFVADEDFSEEDDWDEDDDWDEEEYYEINCPECGNIYFTEFEAFEMDAVSCPECGAHFHLNESPQVSCDDPGCDCHRED